MAAQHSPDSSRIGANGPYDEEAVTYQPDEKMNDSAHVETTDGKNSPSGHGLSPEMQRKTM